MEGKTLIAYFSAEGTTAKVAEQLAKLLNADLFEIAPSTPYTRADLDWRDDHSRSSIEMQDEACRPEYVGDVDVAPYENILIGFPVWWYKEPRIIDTFLDRHDFAGKNMIPFATSGSSGIESSEEHLKAVYPDLNWRKGRLIRGNNLADFANSL